MATPNRSSPLPDTATQPELDVESQTAASASAVRHWQLVFDPAGVNDVVLNHKYRGEGTAESPFVVDFLPGDAHNPMLFPRWKKWTITLLQAMATLAVAFVSTAYSGGMSEIIRDFHVAPEIAVLGISLFVVGFAIGPLLWAPASGNDSS